ncbi:hydrolase [Frondihabitans sp. PAMC 28766]|uniref:serine hydrolase domain-containing protein n=1 Tax=Frondihabitans sp. PAMC 28766 TaxID=1795630 RepID=UPI00078EB1E3|nr:serine hydrolase [Frondihabitans sp. PAMC 28766]AMM20646.1 hydrolase [Frondihabitans sp. PAMC 28766]
MTSAQRVLDQFVRNVDAEGLGAYGVHVLIGDDVAEHRWRSDDRENVYSVSKGVCALAAGIAVGDGLIGLDSTVGEFFPSMQLGAGVDGITLRHLLTMTSGIKFQWFGDQPVPGAATAERPASTPDLAQVMLGLPSNGAGTAFLYTDSSPYVAMRMLETVVGDVRDWLIPRLFEPLGIDNPQWHRCPLGSIMGGTGLELRTEELARIGRLLRDRGQWNGQALVDGAWIDQMHEATVATRGTGDSARYGLAVWGGPGDAWRLDGRYGQYVVVDQGRDAVITVTAHEESGEHRLAELAQAAVAEHVG